MRLIGAVSAPTSFLIAAAAGPLLAQGRPAPASWLRPCLPDGIEGQVWCGRFPVFENREAQSGNRIELNVIIVASTARQPTPDPVVFLQGGPGGAATEAATTQVRVLALARQRRDLVFIDQRGTGSSNPLDCDGRIERDGLQRHFDEFLEPAFVRHCQEQLEANVALYTTPIAMDDLNEVRAALGYAHINLFGGSYGTRAALVYLRRHAATVRSAVLKGVAPTNMKNPLPFAWAAERGLRAVFDACAVEPACHHAFPDLERKWQQTMAHFESGPVSTALPRQATDGWETVNITRGVSQTGFGTCSTRCRGRATYRESSRPAPRATSPPSPSWSSIRRLASPTS